MISDNLFSVSTLFSAFFMTLWSFLGGESLDTLYVGLLTSILIITFGKIGRDSQEKRSEVKESLSKSII